VFIVKICCKIKTIRNSKYRFSVVHKHNKQDTLVQGRFSYPFAHIKTTTALFKHLEVCVSNQ
jgi:hypothetical protein